MSNPLQALHRQKELVRRARQRFFDGEQVEGVISDAVLRSWQRSQQLGLQHTDKLFFSSYLSKYETRRLKEQSRRLVDACLPSLKRLSGALAPADWLVLCTNAEGTILETIGGTESQRALGDPLGTGRSLLETEFGTNAPACVLVEQRQIILDRYEHFLDEVCPYVCAAAPIFDAHDRLAGVINVTSHSRPLTGAVLEMLSLATRISENQLFASSSPQGTIVSLHHDPELLGSPLQGLITLSDDFRILAANRVAREMLSLSAFDESGSDAKATFGKWVSLYQQLRHLDRSSSRIECANGTAVYLRTTRLRSGFEQPSRAGDEAPASSLPTDQEHPDRAFVCKDSRIAESLSHGTKAVKNDLPVVIQGETGTGKEVVALALHNLRRPRGAFVAVNCAAIPEGLIESELFGYAEGAFTGSRKGGATGKIVQANGGTLFLDEIGEMAPLLQTRLLRVLQDRVVSPIGAASGRAVDITVISATHRDLENMVRSGRFREDLFYRLCGLNISLPPLREREDLEDLIEYFLACEVAAGRAASLSEAVHAAFLRYAWPGNVRELQQAVRAAVAIADGVPIESRHLPPRIRDFSEQLNAAGPHGQSLHLLELVELDAIKKSLHKCGGNISATAKELGISRGTLYKRLGRC